MKWRSDRGYGPPKSVRLQFNRKVGGPRGTGAHKRLFCTTAASSRMTQGAPETQGPANQTATSRAFSRPVELLLYAASPVATVVTAPLLARSLGVEDRGHYGVALAVVGFALTISAWGQGETLLAQARLGRNYYRPQARLTLIGGIIMTGCAFPLVLGLGVPWPLAVAAVVFMPLINQTWLWRSWCIARGELRLPAVYGFAAAVSRGFLIVLGALAGVLGGVSAMVTTQATLALSAIGALGLYVRRTVAGLPRLHGNYALLLRSGGAVIAFDVCNAVTLRSDLIVLALFSGPTEVGIYAAPASLTTAALAVSFPFKARAQSLAIAGAPIRRLMRELGLVVAVTTVVAATCVVLAEPLVRALFGVDFTDSTSVVRLLAPAAVCLVACDVAQGVLIVLARRVDLIAVGLVSAVVVCVSLVVLTPAYGADGAALALVIGYTFAALVAWTFIVRRMR